MMVRTLVVRNGLIAVLTLVALVSGLHASDADRFVDTRLSEPVTVSAPAIPVCELLENLSKQTRVALSADEHIRDRKVSIFVRDRPLTEVMEHLRTHLHCAWRSETGKSHLKTYELWQDKKSLDNEEWLRQSKKAEGIEQRREKRRRAVTDRLSAYKNALSLTEGELSKLAVDDPNLVADLLTPVSRSTTEFLSDSPDILAQLLSGDSLDIPFDKLSDDLKKCIEDDLRKRVDPGRPIPLVTTVILGGEEYPADVNIGYVTTDKEVSGPFPWVVVRDKDRYPEGVVEGLVKDGVMNGAQRAEYLDRRQALRDKAVKADEDALKDAGPEPTDPDLLKKVDLDLKSLTNPVEVVMEALAKASGLNLLADHFTAYPEEIPPWCNEEMALYKVLHAVCSIYECDWEKQGSYLIITDRKWYDKAPREVPKRFVDKWSALLKDKKFLTLDELATVASELTPAQTSGLRYHKVLAPIRLTVNSFNHRALVFYHSLSESQRRTAAQDGLPWKTMTPAQKDLFANVTELLHVSPSRQQLAEYGLLTVAPATGVRKVAGRKIMDMTFRFGPDSSKDAFPIGAVVAE